MPFGCDSAAWAGLVRCPRRFVHDIRISQLYRGPQCFSANRLNDRCPALAYTDAPSSGSSWLLLAPHSSFLFLEPGGARRTQKKP